MKKQRKKYESPLMERTLVELEDGFCAGSVDVTPTDGEKIGEIEVHEVNKDFSDAADFSSGSWD